MTLGKVVKLKAENSADAAQIARILPFIGKTPTGDNKKDAIEVGDAIIDLVKRLGLETNLSAYKVGEDQVPQITKLATGQERGNLYDAVEGLVKTLY